ncbi:MAG: DJ-1 family glyoxalase III [Candidatus Margulisiibacteriota bacterium]
MKALIILADGFEELEAIGVIDILRRAQVQVIIAGLDKLLISSARKIRIETDIELAQIGNELFDVIVLPGGEPGASNLNNSALVRNILINQNNKSGLIGAICAAPKIIDSLGILAGKKATSYPGVKLNSCIYSEDRVVVDKNIITSRGPGTTMEFSYEILAQLGLAENAVNLKLSMLAR